MRKEDFGVNDKTFIVNCHLGEVLNFNDTVLCYDLETAAISEIDEYEMKDLNIPEVVVVKKTFPKYRKNRRTRIWKLKHFDDIKGINAVDDEEMSDDDGEEAKEGEKKKQQPKRNAKKKQKKLDRKDKTNTVEYK